MTEHLCESCRQPGACCSGFQLNQPQWDDLHPLQVMVELASILTDDCQGRPMIGVPFLPTGRSKQDGRQTYQCGWLGDDGRCSNYEDRPMLCASFEAGSDLLCVMTCPGVGAARQSWIANVSLRETEYLGR